MMDYMLRHLSYTSKVVTVNVEYRCAGPAFSLGPSGDSRSSLEPFPLPHDDSFAALKWVSSVNFMSAFA